jgi:hypothetical protein
MELVNSCSPNARSSFRAVQVGDRNVCQPALHRAETSSLGSPSIRTSSQTHCCTKPFISLLLLIWYLQKQLRWLMNGTSEVSTQRVVSFVREQPTH